MKTPWGRHTGLALGALVFPFLFSATAIAETQFGGQRMWLACENGRNYPLQPMAVSRENDIVTGYLLQTEIGRSVRLRLVPMGNGYRYAGPGIWFDGVRGEAVLNWGRPNEVPCAVLQE